jgi:Immunity protein 8
MKKKPFALEIRDIHSSDLDIEKIKIDKHAPDEAWFPLSFTIGIDGDSRGDNFEVFILNINAARNSNIWRKVKDSKYLILEAIDYQSIIVSLERNLMECTAEDWLDSINMLRKRFHWEYEDYKN